MNKLHSYLSIVSCAVFWGVVFSPVLMRIDVEYESIQSAMIYLCVANILASLGLKKILQTELQPGITGVIFSFLYTLVISVVVLLLFQFSEAKYG